MSDRTSAGIFGMVFEELASMHQSTQVQLIAKRFWKLSHNYDFHPSQMEVDPCLEVLGLAEIKTLEGDDYETVRYRLANGRTWGKWS